MQAVILAGGRGTRLAPYTAILPKPLMPVADRPILEIIIRQLKIAGFSDVELAVGYLSSLIEAYFGNGENLGVRITYHKEEKPAGTAGPLALMEDVLAECFLVMNGDVLTDLDYRSLYKRHVDSGAVLTAATCTRSVTLPLGAIVFNENNEVTDYVEKPTYTFECSAGIYVMNRQVLKCIEREKAFDLPQLVRALLAERLPVSTYPIDGMWLDIGTPDDYRIAADYYEQKLRQSLEG